MHNLTHLYALPEVNTYELRRLLSEWSSSGAHFDTPDYKEIVTHFQLELRKIAPTYVPHHSDRGADERKWPRNAVEATFRLVELARDAYPGEVTHCAQIIREEREALADGSAAAIAAVVDPSVFACGSRGGQEETDEPKKAKHTVDGYAVNLGQRRIVVVNHRVFRSTAAAVEMAQTIASVLDGEFPPFNEERPFWFDGANIRQGETRILATVDGHYHLAGDDSKKAMVIARRLNGMPASLEESREIAARAQQTMMEAECMRSVRTELVKSDIIDKDVPDLYIAAAVDAKVRLIAAIADKTPAPAL